jgi:hypothetical protein
MNPEEHKNLIDKYLAGESTPEEENKLHHADLNDSEGLDLWFTYIRLNKAKTPEGLNEVLWNESVLSKSKFRSLLIPITSIAASIAVLLFFLPLNLGSTVQSHEEKQRLWDEAMLMVQQAEINEDRDILYEDELITISIISD